MKNILMGAAIVAALTTGAHAQTSYSTGFEAGDGYVAGTAPSDSGTEGNAGWVQAGNGSTFGQYTNAAAKSGTQSLAIIRAQTINSGVIHGVRSPELLLPTGDGAGSAASGATYRQFNSSFWVRTGQTNTTDPYFMSVNAWSNDRMTWVGFDYNSSQPGLAIYALGTNPDGSFKNEELVAGGLTAGSWYRIDQQISFGPGGDAVTFSVFDESLAQLGNVVTTTWESYFTTFQPPVRPINQLNFRTSVDTAGVVAYVDDVTYSVGAAVPEPATWAMMVGGFGLLGGAMRRRAAVKAVLA